MTQRQPDGTVNEPHALWLGMVRYYGTLAAQPGWAHLHTLFDFVKQIATSQVGMDFYPSLVDDVLYIARKPLAGHPSDTARVSIELTEARTFWIKQYEPAAATYRDLTCTREQALPVLAHIVRSL